MLADTKNGLLAVDPRDYGVSRGLLKDGAYDWDDILWLGQLLGPTSRVVVVGAHLGAVVIPLAAHSRTPRVLAFEPSPRNHTLLTINLKLNGLANFVRVEKRAVGAQVSRATFRENATNTGNGSIAPDGSVSVDVTTLDTAVPADWEQIDLLVMDVEGHEVHALRGGAATLAKTRYLYVEYAPEQLQEHGTGHSEFIEEVAKYFPSVYLRGGLRPFALRQDYVGLLGDMASQRGLLVNLLFSHDAEPDPALIELPPESPSATGSLAGA